MIAEIEYRNQIGDTIAVDGKPWIVAEIHPVITYDGITIRYFVERGKKSRLVWEKELEWG